jgi:hypothetical protein
MTTRVRHAARLWIALLAMLCMAPDGFTCAPPEETAAPVDECIDDGFTDECSSCLKKACCDLYVYFTSEGTLGYCWNKCLQQTGGDDAPCYLVCGAPDEKTIDAAECVKSDCAGYCD